MNRQEASSLVTPAMWLHMARHPCAATALAGTGVLPVKMNVALATLFALACGDDLGVTTSRH